MLRKCGFINFLIHFIGQTISACAWNLPASDSSHVVLHLVHGMKPYTHQLLSSRMKSDSDCKTSLGKLSASSCWSQKKKKKCSVWQSIDLACSLGECREAVAELPVQCPIQILFSQQQQNLQDSRVEALFCGCYMATSSPSGSDVSQPQGISPLATVIEVWSSVFFFFQ